MNTSVHRRVDNSCHYSLSCRMNPVYILTPYPFGIHFYIIPLSTPWSPKWPLPFCILPLFRQVLGLQGPFRHSQLVWQFPLLSIKNIVPFTHIMIRYLGKSSVTYFNRWFLQLDYTFSIFQDAYFHTFSYNAISNTSISWNFPTGHRKFYLLNFQTFIFMLFTDLLPDPYFWSKQYEFCCNFMKYIFRHIFKMSDNSFCFIDIISFIVIVYVYFITEVFECIYQKRQCPGRKSSAFYGRKNSLPCLQKPSTGSYSVINEQIWYDITFQECHCFCR